MASKLKEALCVIGVADEDVLEYIGDALRDEDGDVEETDQVIVAMCEGVGAAAADVSALRLHARDGVADLEDTSSVG